MSYHVRRLQYELKREALARARVKDLDERKYLRTLKFTDDEMLRYQCRLIGIERRAVRVMRRLGYDIPPIDAYDAGAPIDDEGAQRPTEVIA